MNQPLLEVNRLKKHFPIKGGFFQRTVGNVHAVDGVSFRLEKGETLGLVGESGCGKSTTGRLILRLIKPTSGEIRFNGQDIGRLDRRRMKAVRRDMQLIFQDPYASLNPRLTVGGIVSEAFKIHGVASGAELEDRTVDLLKRVGLHAEHLRRYPHEFSGGQRQRIGIARALALNPKLIIADEPVSALDVSIQAQVINLLQDLKSEFQLSYIIIAHDLSVVEYMFHTRCIYRQPDCERREPEFADIGGGIMPPVRCGPAGDSWSSYSGSGLPVHGCKSITGSRLKKKRV